MWCKSSLCSLPLFFYGLSAYSRPAACLGVIIILVLSILFSALDVGRIPSLDCQTQRVSKGKGWASKLLAGPCNAFLFPPSSCAFNDDECRAVDPGTIEGPAPWTLRGNIRWPPWPWLRGHLISPESQNKNSLDDPSTDPVLLRRYI